CDAAGTPAGHPVLPRNASSGEIPRPTLLLGQGRGIIPPLSRESTLERRPAQGNVALQDLPWLLHDQAVERALYHGRPVAGGMFVGPGSPRGPNPAPRRPGSRGRAVRVPLRQRGSVRTVADLASHRHVSAEPPFRYQRDAARCP